MSKVKFQLKLVKSDDAWIRTYVNLNASENATTFIHVPGVLGFMDEDSEWVQYLAAKYRFVSYEPREMLVKKQGLLNYSMKTRVLDLLRVIQTYSKTSKGNIILLASSIGAGVSTLFHLIFPEKTSALIFLAPKFYHEFNVFEYVSLFAPRVLLDVITLLQDLILPFYVDFKNDPRQAFNVKYMLSQTSLVAFQKTARELLWNYDVRPFLKQISKPLIIIGAREDKLHETNQYYLLQDSLSHAIIKEKILDSQVYHSQTMQEIEKYLHELKVPLIKQKET